MSLYVKAMIASNQSTKNNALMKKTMTKLSTGSNINKAGDDCARFAISEKMRAQIKGMAQADRNVQDGISLVQTAEGAMHSASGITQRMRELCIQGSSDTLSNGDRDKITEELNQLGEEILKISSETKFNNHKILSEDGNMSIQAGADNDIRYIPKINLKKIAETLTGGEIDISNGQLTKPVNIDISTPNKARDFINKVDTALSDMVNGITTLGAIQNRLEHVSSNLKSSQENLSIANSRITDLDMAKEILEVSKLNTLNELSQSMISQAKQHPENVAKLLTN